MSDFETGSILDGRYEILGVLGTGGMGCVYKARQLHLDRMVAIKVPSAAIRENMEFLARFIREARACAKIAHDHIVAIYDVHSGQQPYIVMEYVDGMPLHHYLHEQGSSVFISDLMDILGQVCEGLAEAHAKGVVHRDIKPGNIVITRNNLRAKIMDFGIARIEEETGLTVSGSLMGTPYYMAPEQIRGEEIGPAVDLYSLAAMVYQLFTGKQVFEGSISSLVYQHVHTLPRAPSELNSALPKALDLVLLRALSKNPEDRYDSTVEFHREMRMALRPVLNLPFSQIFAMPTESPGLTYGSAATQMAAGATSDEKPVAASAPSLQPSPPPPPHPPTPIDPYAPTIQMACDAGAGSLLSGRKRLRWWLLPTVVLAIAALIATAYLANRNASQKGEGTRAVLSQDGSRDNAQEAHKNDLKEGSDTQAAEGVAAESLPGRSGVLPQALRWVRAPLSVYSQAESQVLAMWVVEPAGAKKILLPVTVTVEQTGAESRIVWRKRTLSGRVAIRLPGPGEYAMAVEILGAQTSVAPLRNTIRVTP